MVCCLCVFVEYCTDTEVIQPEGVLEGRKFATPHEAYASWFASIFQSHFTRLRSSSRLVERIGLVVVQDTQSLYEHMTTLVLTNSLTYPLLRRWGLLLGRGVEGLLRIECLRVPHFPFIELRDTSNSYFNCLVVSTDFVHAAI